MNLVVPFQAMRELYNRSAGEDVHQANADVGDATAWWACALGAFGVNGFLWFQDWFNSNGLVFIQAHWLIEMAMDLLAAVLIAGAGWFLMGLVQDITREQTKLAGSSQTFA